MNQQRTIMGACDYSIASLQNIKSALMDLGNPQKQSNWAMGGLIVTLTSHLLRVSQETLLESIKSEESNAKNDIEAIKTKFNEFVDRMINNE